jgi:hypothetical protein
VPLILGEQRVCSLRATLVGDFAQAKGSSIYRPALSGVIAILEIHAETL